MKLTEGQERALHMVKDFLTKEVDGLAVLTGFAGTGKSTMLRVLAREFGTPTVVAPTGKAAMRVSEASGLSAKTIHRWLYNVVDDDRGLPAFVRKKPDDLEVSGNRLLVIDEASMVGSQLWQDLALTSQEMAVRILAVGDPFQLPPVTSVGEPPFSLLEEKTSYRAQLTEVMRQALDSPIIRASMLLRERRDAFDAVLQLVNVVFKSQLVSTASQILARGGTTICYSNKLRNDLNVRIREAAGHQQPLPCAGEPLLVVRNNYVLDRFNGEIVQLQRWVLPCEKTDRAEKYRSRDHKLAPHSLYLAYGVASVEGRDVVLAPDQVLGKVEHLSLTDLAKHGERAVGRRMARKRDDRLPFLAANLGYALTGHKSQGSEWPEVLVVLEPYVSLESTPGRRWAYTALTRAKKSVWLAVLQ